MLELPRGSVVCDIDNQGNIFKTLEDIDHHQCIAGGLPYSMFIIGSPQEMRDQGLSALDIIDECNAGMVDQGIDKMSAAFIFAMVGGGFFNVSDIGAGFPIESVARSRLPQESFSPAWEWVLCYCLKKQDPGCLTTVFLFFSVWDGGCRPDVYVGGGRSFQRQNFWP